MNPVLVALQRVRLRLSRSADARFLTHLQQIEVVRNALSKSNWPIAKSQAKKARVKAAFGPAISVGYESAAEYCDVELEGRLDFVKAKASLTPHLPPGYDVIAVKSIPRFFPSLDQTLNAVSYLVTADFLKGTSPLWEEFSKKENFYVVKKKESGDKTIDARACVKSWSLEENSLRCILRFGSGRTLKPEKIIQAVCGLTDHECDPSRPDSVIRVVREQFYLEKSDGSLIEP